MTDPFIFRGLERLLVVAVAGLFGYLGFRLFREGHTRGRSLMSIDSTWAKIVLSGTGPGLFFMFFAVCVLIYALASGGVKTTERASVDALHEEVTDLRQEFRVIESEMQMLEYELVESDGQTDDARPAE